MGIIIRSNWRGELVKARSRESAQAGVIRAAEHLRTQAVRQAPVDEGDLRRSASAVNLSGLGLIRLSGAAMAPASRSTGPTRSASTKS